MTERLWKPLGLLVLASVASIGIVREGGTEEAPSTPQSPISKIGPGLFRVGAIDLDVNKTSPTLRMPAQVNMQEGMIELLACSSEGKLHESLFLAHVEPYHLHLALLLMGLKPKGGVRYQGDTKQPQGDKVVIYVEKNGRRRVEDYIWDRVREAPMERTGWVFTGSRMVEGGYGAQLTRTLITTYRDPYAILDNPLPSGADDTVYEVNHRVTPPVGTTVTLVIQPLKLPSEKKNAKGESQ